MELETAVPESLSVLEKYNIVNIGVRAGQGHLTMAGELGRAEDLMAILYRHSQTEEEVRASLRLNFLNDEILTRIVPGRLNSLGIQVMNTFMNPIYKLGGAIADQTKTGEYPWDITYHAERRLAEVFARYVNKTNPDSLVFTLASGARITNVAKAKGLIRADLPVFNIVCDPLGPDLTYGIYDPRSEFGIDPHTINLVGDERSRRIFLERGYPQEQVKLVNTFYARSLEEEETVIAKMRDYEHFKTHGPDPLHPLQVSIVHDSFRTKFEDGVTLNILGDYAAEAQAGSIFFYMTVDRALLPKFGAKDDFVLIESAAGLEQLIQNPDQRAGRKGALIIKPGITNDMATHSDYSRIQSLLAKQTHLNISRPSEHPRVAARFNTPSLMTIPFASQEAYMARLYRNAGFAGHWMQLSRGRLSAIRRRQSGLPQLDLMDPQSYRLLEKMAYAAGASNQHNSIQEIQHVIAGALEKR